MNSMEMPITVVVKLGIASKRDWSRFRAVFLVQPLPAARP